MVMRHRVALETPERVVELGRVVIPSDNTPVKAVGSLLIPAPVWKYKGPARTITLTYQVGRWGVGFAGDTAIVTESIIQEASPDWGTFDTQDTPLKGVKLSGLKSTEGDFYDMQMWFKATGMDDQGAIFTECCKVSAAPALEIVSCSFS